MFARISRSLLVKISVGILALSFGAGLEAETPPAADNCPNPALTITLGEGGIQETDLVSPEAPKDLYLPKKPAPSDSVRPKIKVVNATDDQWFDVTFVVEISTAQMRREISNLGENPRDAFSDAMEQRYAGQAQEIHCDAFDRCELTLVFLKPRDSVCFDPSFLAMEEREVTMVQVLAAKGKSTTKAEDLKGWDRPDRSVGYLSVVNGNAFRNGSADLVVHIDDTGISSWRFLNPRSPAVVFPDGSLPVESVSAIDLRQRSVSYLEYLLSQIRVEAGLDQNPPATAVAAPDLQASGSAAESQEADRLRPAIEAANEILKQARADLKLVESQTNAPIREEVARITGAALRVLARLVSSDSSTGASAVPVVRQSAKDALTEIGNWAGSAEPEAPIRAAVIGKRALDELAVAEKSALRLAGPQDVVLREKKISFENSTSDRTFEVSFVLQLEACGVPDAEQELRAFEEQQGGALKLTPIPDKPGHCTGTISVNPNDAVVIDARVVDRAPNDLLTFNVDFFEQIEKPARATGYIALTPKAARQEPEDKLVLKGVAGLTTRYDPSLGEDDILITEPDVVPKKICNGKLSTDPRCIYQGDVTRHYVGTGRVDLTQTFGNRANASLSLQYKTGDLGVANESLNKITASQYQANVFATNDTSLNLGKRTFAEPSKGIAVREAGEGFQFTWKWFEATYILNRESATGIANDDDEDNDSIILQVKDIGTHRLVPFFRRVSLTAVRGEERLGGKVPGDGQLKEVNRFLYKTAGLEGFFKVRRMPLSGSLAWYWSERDSRNPDLTKLEDGKGDVGLLTVGLPIRWEQAGNKRKPVSTFTAFFGLGDGDDPKTPNFNEGYIGEGAKFANDQLFLSSIGSSISTGGNGTVGRGLSNKEYLGLQYIDNRTSLLGSIAKLLGIDPADVISESTTLGVHTYHFRENVFGNRDGGWEYDMNFRLESPKGVKWFIDLGYFQPGNALDPVFKEKAWTAAAGVSIEP